MEAEYVEKNDKIFDLSCVYVWSCVNCYVHCV